MGLEQLVDSLLYEGYALFPYTPDAAKNATPTPFGIVYPPVYADECSGAFDHARLECVAAGGTAIRATVRYLVPSGERFEASERRVELGPIEPGGRASRELEGARFTVRWGSEEEPGVVRCCVHNTTTVAAGLDRGGALKHSLISVHIVLQIDGGQFVSPLETGRTSVNTWPVLASDVNDAILGAAIVLPDHPRISPQSFGNLFDNTEIEEALALHVHVLSDEERTAASSDPTVKEMLARTMALTPAELIDLHSGLRPDDTLSRGQVDNNPGVPKAVIDGVVLEKGGKVLLKPDTERDVYDQILDGRTATLERIYVDYDDRVHLAVTVDDDPGQQLMRETGRYLFFKANEVHPL
ncbi:MAG: hypothetical protein ACYDHH_08080 [Solirubrobacteraceae bacterium]